MDTSIIIMTVAFLLLFTAPYVLLSVLKKKNKKNENKETEN